MLKGDMSHMSDKILESVITYPRCGGHKVIARVNEYLQQMLEQHSTDIFNEQDSSPINVLDRLAKL